MSAVLHKAVEQLCHEIKVLARRVEALEGAANSLGGTRDRLERATKLQWAVGDAITIIEALDAPVDAEMLAKHIAVSGGAAPTATILKWLRSVVVRGAADPSHPLFPYLIEKKPLRFGRKKEVAALAGRVR